MSTHPICILTSLKGTKSAMRGIGGHTFRLSYKHCLSVLSAHIPTLSNINVVSLNTYPTLSQLDYTDCCAIQVPRFGHLHNTDPFPSPLIRHGRRSASIRLSPQLRPLPFDPLSPDITNGTGRSRKMDRCIAKALPNQTICTISSLLVILAFLVVCCFLSSAHSPLTSRRTTDEK
jgi:hypothetical protein